MFISSSFLEVTYGVDSKIASFFVDREPPASNLYWHEKLLYLRPSPGYLFIPLIVDLFHRLGLQMQQLLSDPFVQIMEQVGHISALEETKQITAGEAIRMSIELVKEVYKNKGWYDNLVNYFSNENDNFFTNLSVPNKALRRGDLFLFAVCALSFPEKLSEKIAEQWFALISILLLLDDAEDIETDKETGDENAFIEVGLHAEGIYKINELADCSLTKISNLSPAMALELRRQYRQFAGKFQMPGSL